MTNLVKEELISNKQLPLKLYQVCSSDAMSLKGGVHVSVLWCIEVTVIEVSS